MSIDFDLVRQQVAAERPAVQRRAGRTSLIILVVLTITQACADSQDGDDELEAWSQALSADGGDAGADGGDGGDDAEVLFDAGSLGGFAGGTGGRDASPPPLTDASFDAGGRRDAGGGTVGGPIGGDGGVPGAGGPASFANWKFDDCGSSLTLRDSSPSAANAVRSAQVACAQGLVGGAVLIDSRRDTISAPAQAAFDVSERVAMAAWIHPTNIQQGIVIAKELNRSGPFELSLSNRNLVFRIEISNGRRTRQVTSRAPIQANRWTHVAALYDGSFVRLFIDGAQVGQVAASGPIADVPGAIQIGNNQSNDFLRGRIDEVWLSRAPVTEADIRALSCIVATPTLVATPSTSGPQPLGTSFSYDVAVTNRDVGACPSRNAFISAFEPSGQLISNVSPSNLTLAPGATAHTTLQVTSSFDTEPGTFQVPVNAIFFGDRQVTQVPGSVEYVATPPTGCFVRTSRELIVRDLSVVEDPLRTSFDGPSSDPRSGAWTFGKLMQQLAASDAQGPDLVERTFNSWLSDQTINGFNVPAKPSMRTLVLNDWPRTPDGKLDIKRAPLRLLAIVNRIDSRNLAQGHAGEGRFVFGVLGPLGFPEEFTVIFEYRLPAQTPEDVLAWAERWHALGSLPFPSEEYNAALQALTDRFVLRGAEPGRANGSALAQFRTNEIALTQQLWELREFELSASTHFLEPSTVKLTPDTGFQFDSPLVADFVNQNEAAVLLEQHTVPELFQGQRFVGGSSFNDLFAWVSAGIVNSEARHKFSLNTCNGCHASEENGTGFLHIFPRFPGEVAGLSGFMQGTVIPDPVTRIPREFNDLGRRNRDLTQLVCPAPTAASRSARSAGTSGREAFIAKGIDRTH